jgi:uncharacterized protein YbjT (DUF2867 family)
MKILLTGATGYIGRRLLPVLIEHGHEVVCLVRDADRFSPPESIRDYIEILEGDLLDADSLRMIPENIDAAYYLVHSMATSRDYQEMEWQSAKNFRERINVTNCKQVIFLSGIINEDDLSDHLNSRRNVEFELGEGNYALTTLRAGIIIGSGSASFEIIRDLVEKLPVMIAPIWLKTLCQPIGVSDVMQFLVGVLHDERTYNDHFDIGGPDILSYKEMLLEFANVRGLKRRIGVVPVMTPRLSSYWLYFVTSTSYKLATALVDSMKVNVVCSDNRLAEMLGIQTITYRQALEKAFERIVNNEILSSWKDALTSGRLDINITDFIDVPEYGCFKDIRVMAPNDREAAIERVWRIGGKTGWYYATWLWQLRGLMDKMVGGVGLRRGRTRPQDLMVGDAVDFWRVLYANKEEGRLLLFAEMRLPGEAWLEFRMKKENMVQTATYRPKGLWGRVYWYMVLPFHGFIFRGMLKKITA